MASDSEPKKIFRFTDARRRVLEHFGLENQHLAADGFLPAIFAFFK
jgi:predicted metalloprotease